MEINRGRAWPHVQWWGRGGGQKKEEYVSMCCEFANFTRRILREITIRDRIDERELEFYLTRILFFKDTKI